MQSGSPAAQAGLKAGTKRQQVDGASILLGGDVIQAINGKKVITSDDLASAISSMKPGDKVSVQLRARRQAGHGRSDARQAAEPGADRLTAQARPAPAPRPEPAAWVT